LRIEGYEVITAEDGIKGIQIARKEKPDLIILDIMMPGLDGHTVCDMLKKSTLTWSISVIYLTARTSQADEIKALEKGAKFYLTKPYNAAALFEMVKSVLVESDESTPKEGLVLLVDKDLAFVDECEARLRQAGYDVIVAPTAAEGLQVALSRHPDLILLDFLTSHADGHVSIKTISHDDVLKDIPLFVLAPASIIDKADPKTANLEKFIPKPVSYARLLETLQRALEMQKTPR
ncbi:MAG: response regulator, partial [Acidobacteriota bacterium]